MGQSRQERIDALPPHLRELLRGKLAAEQPAAPDEDVIAPVDRTGAIPQSFSQQRMWFLHEFEPNSVGYNSCFGLRLLGELDEPALKAALDGVVARHESLRTTFDSVDGRGVQLIRSSVDVPWRVLDLADSAPQDRDGYLDRMIASEVSIPFDLRTGPLVRAMLAKLDDREHVLVLSLHHINHDGWSLSILADELGELYRAAVSRREPRLEPLSLQYADFAAWQRERFSGGALDEQLAYWREHLAGLTPLQLPADRPRPAVPGSSGAVHEFGVPASVMTELRRISRDCNATTFMTLVAATQLLLSRYSGQQDIAVGTPVAGRKDPALDRMIGFFLNTLVLRTGIEPDGSFTDLLGQVREVVLDAFANEDVPFEQVVDAVAPGRDISRMPLSPVLVVMQNTPEANLDLGGLRAEQLRLPQASSGFDLVFGFEERADGSLWAAIEYGDDLFNATTIMRLAAHFGALLQSLVTRPDLPVATLSMLSGDEYRQLTVDWARNPGEYPAGDRIHDLVARQVAANPSAPAMICGSVRVTYQELWDRTARVAGYLRAQGVQPGDVVGVCLERGVDQVSCALAVLTTGAVYLPLDPKFPADRRDFMVEDTDARLVLTSVPDGSPDMSEVNMSPDDLAYIVYTSGSTGKPKGVRVAHRGLVNMVNTAINRFALGPGKRVTHLASPSFDGAIWEIFTALASGACLCAPDEGIESVPRALEGVPALVSLPPAALTALDPADFAKGTVVLAVGDRCPVDTARLWSTHHRFVNGYGPTEITIGATMSEVDIPPGAVRVPIGRPLPNTEVYVLDAYQQPVPVGVTGEIYLGGVGVAKGYVNRPDLTEQRFVAHPFVPGARVYRTGDLGAWTADGVLDFRGRADHQIKIRGFRVEPGEIESALVRHPSVSQAAVVLQEDGGPSRLVGYLVAEEGLEVDIAAVREFVSGCVPEFMVPSALVVLDELPLSSNGKVDRARLPAVSVERTAQPPSTPVEAALAAVFSAALNVQQVGVHDDFFELGGDSILSIQVVSGAQRAGLRITSKDVFRHRTVAQLARIAQVVSAEDADTQPVVGPVPLTPVQCWFLSGEPANPHHFAQSVLMSVASDVDEAVLVEALSALMNHHDALRMRYTFSADGWHQENLAEARWTHDSVVASSPSDIDEACAAAQAGMHLTDGPLVRSVLIRHSSSVLLFLTVHHLVVDGVSWRILLDDLQTAYRQLAAGSVADLGPRTSSFRDWAVGLREFTVAGGFDDELDHWRSVASTARGQFDGGTVADARTLSVSLDAADADVLLRQVPAVYRTQVNDVLLAAVGRALGTWTGQDQVLVDMEGHGREEILESIDLTRTVGWFTTVYPVALTIPDGPISDVVRSVKRELRKIPRRGIGYGALRYFTESVPDIRPDISFNYLGQWSQTSGSDLLRDHVQHNTPDHSPSLRRAHVIDIVAGVQADGRLEFTWTYAADLHKEQEIRGVAGTVLDCLRDLTRPPRV